MSDSDAVEISALQSSWAGCQSCHAWCGSSVANTALQSGSVQFVLASAASVLLATSRNVPLLVVGGINKEESLQLVVVNRWIKAHGMLSRCSDEYKSVRLPSPHISKLFTTAKMVE